MRKFRKSLLLIGLVLLMVMITGPRAGAQTTLDNPPPSTCLPTDPDYDPRLCVPIDGGLAILLLAGIGYGVKKYRIDTRRKDLSSLPE